jgi:hypothetical protein
MLVCAFQEMGCLLVSLGTTASSILLDSQSGPVTTAFAVLVHPCQAARLAAAWCLRCVCVAAPSQTTPVIDKYLDLMNLSCFAKNVGSGVWSEWRVCEAHQKPLQATAARWLQFWEVFVCRHWEFLTPKAKYVIT